jgi:hypothetical protein
VNPYKDRTITTTGSQKLKHFHFSMVEDDTFLIRKDKRTPKDRALD